jgi:hypothetical protein
MLYKKLGIIAALLIEKWNAIIAMAAKKRRLVSAGNVFFFIWLLYR